MLLLSISTGFMRFATSSARTMNAEYINTFRGMNVRFGKKYVVGVRFVRCAEFGAVFQNGKLEETSRKRDWAEMTKIFNRSAEKKEVVDEETVYIDDVEFASDNAVLPVDSEVPAFSEVTCTCIFYCFLLINIYIPPGFIVRFIDGRCE